jgi:hypothetical protein
MGARGQNLAVELDTKGSSWDLAAYLLALYEILYAWDANRRRILVGSLVWCRPSTSTKRSRLWAGPCSR